MSRNPVTCKNVITIYISTFVLFYRPFIHLFSKVVYNITIVLCILYRLLKEPTNCNEIILDIKYLSATFPFTVVKIVTWMGGQ